MSPQPPQSAMVLAAGLGKRMRPITDTIPKPLVRISGKPLLDWGLDALERAGVSRAIVNTHYLGAQIADHVAHRSHPGVTISDESECLLDSAGGIIKALPLLGEGPFFILNADTFWIDEGEPSLAVLARSWDPRNMDILLLVTDPARATGHSGGTDFLIDNSARLSRSHGDLSGVIYAGAGIVHPRIFEGACAEPHSLNRYFNSAIAAGRLFGHRLRGQWITVGTPDAIPLAEAAVARTPAEMS